MNPTVVRAIFKRNFLNYFSSPTGYVFICVFVLMCGIAATWPNEFFNRNLANLDQLNTWLPYILLVFIPAITMSIWAQERQQGTDELLLTLPASDFDVVLGKYLAAAGIYTVAMLFSSTIILVLFLLGHPDVGLLFSNYVGYWLVGLAMLSVGMVASFLTDNLTVGFILGAMFNAPLVFANWASAISGLLSDVASTLSVVIPSLAISETEVAQHIVAWSIAQQLSEFGRGVISFASVVFFVLVVVWSLYLCMVLIGRRHWSGGANSRQMATHYVVRTVALGLVLVACYAIFSRTTLRADVTSERLSSLSPQTVKVLNNLENERGVQIDAYISPVVPESYVQTRANLINMLDEIDAQGGDKVRVRIFPTVPYSEESSLAEEQYGIEGREVATRARGAMNIEEIYMGAAITSGLDRVVVPFFDRGIPPEYELVRSIATVSQEQRKRVGVLETDAKLYGGFNMQTMGSRPNEQIIDELEKQYEVVQVNADGPIGDDYDVLLAVQPSSLTPDQMTNFIAAVQRGVPTAIFEDPFPFVDSSVPGTTQPRRPQGGSPFMQQQQPPKPKGDISPLWQMLGVRFVGNQVVRQNYNPYPKVGQFPEEFVFVDEGQGASDGVKPPFNAEASISAKLQQVLFLFPGSMQELNAATGLDFESLVITGANTGLVRADEILEQSFMGPGRLNPRRRFSLTGTQYVLAARIKGKLTNEQSPGDKNLSMSDEGLELAQQEESTAEPPAEETAEEPTSEGESEDEASENEASENEAVPPAPKDIDVVIVSDIDVLYSAFFALRSRGNEPDAEVNLQLDNVSFVLNVLDVLAGDSRFVEIRGRRPEYRTLSRFEALTSQLKDSTDEARTKFVGEFDQGQKEEQEAFERRISEIEKDAQEQNLNPNEILRMVALARNVGQRRLDATITRLEQKRDQQIRQAETEFSTQLHVWQDLYKLLAVLIPPIPPLLVGAAVFFNRRVREREGVVQSRLR